MLWWYLYNNYLFVYINWIASFVSRYAVYKPQHFLSYFKNEEILFVTYLYILYIQILSKQEILSNITKEIKNHIAKCINYFYIKNLWNIVHIEIFYICNMPKQ